MHLADPALAAAALGAGPGRLTTDRKAIGLLFESAVIHDLTVYAASLGGEVRHYRDSNQRELDAVIILPDGRWGAVEVKLAEGQIASAAESLRATVQQIDTDVVGEPVFRMVVTGTGPVLTMDDGTITAPLKALTV